MKKDGTNIHGKSVHLRQAYGAPLSEMLDPEGEITRILAAFGGGL